MLKAQRSNEYKPLHLEDFPVAIRETDHWLYAGSRWERYPSTEDYGIEAPESTQELFDALIMRKPHGELYLTNGMDALLLEAQKIKTMADRYSHTRISEFGSSLDTFIRQAFISFAGKEALRLSGNLNEPNNRCDYWLIRSNNGTNDSTDIFAKITGVAINEFGKQWPLVPILSDRRGNSGLMPNGTTLASVVHRV